MKELTYRFFIILVVIILTGCIRQAQDNEIKDTTKISSINTTRGTPIQEKSIAAPSSQQSWYKPKPGISWQLQLQDDIDTAFDVDLYDIDLVETPQSIIDELHDKRINVICYFNAGAYEPYRPDSDQFPKEVLGKVMNGWEDEKWLDVSNYQKFAHIMQARLDMAVQKKCDGVDPDNINGYAQDNGFNITYDDQIRYNKWLSQEAHQRNLSIGLKNGVEQVKDLVDFFDFEVNEQCFQYNECKELLPFINQGKAVLGVEYELEPDEFCEEARRMNFSWLKMGYDLDGIRLACE